MTTTRYLHRECIQAARKVRGIVERRNFATTTEPALTDVDINNLEFFLIKYFLGCVEAARDAGGNDTGWGTGELWEIFSGVEQFRKFRYTLPFVGRVTIRPGRAWVGEARA